MKKLNLKIGDRVRVEQVDNNFVIGIIENFLKHKDPKIFGFTLLIERPPHLKNKPKKFHYYFYYKRHSEYITVLN